MTLNELIQAIETLTPEELQQLRARIEQRQREFVSGSANSLDRALAALRDGLTDEQIDQIEWAMNVEVIEPPDETAWQA
jgi:hypothetical protein